MNRSGASAVRSRRSWCAVLGAVPATVPAKRRSMARCRWPHRMRSTCGWRATTAASAPLFCRPARSMRSMPVRKGGWCIISKTGRAGGDEPDRVVLNRKLEKPVSRQITVSGERGAQRLAGVVIAGNDEDRHRKWCEQRAEMLVFAGIAVIDEVARDDRDIGQRVEAVDLGDRARQEF